MNPSEEVQNQVGSIEDRSGAPADMATASESITSSHGHSGSAGLPNSGGVRHHFRNNQDIYGVATAVVGSVIAMSSVWFALWQFNQQMEAQQKSTATLLVNEFFKQVGELKAIGNAGADDQAKYNANQFIISRAQMLLDAEDTAAHADDIVRFLGANGYGSYFGKRPGVIGQRININHSALTSMKLNDVHLNEASFICVDFSGAVFENIDFNGSSFSYSSMQGVKMISVDFSRSSFSHVNLTKVGFSGNAQFDDAWIFSSDFTGVTLSDSFLRATPGSNVASDASPEKIKYHNFAMKLSKAKTLYQSRFDTEVDKELFEILGEEKYRLKVTESPFMGMVPDTDTSFDSKCQEEKPASALASFFGS